MTASFEHSEAIICPRGPMLLRGRHIVEDTDGIPHETTRPVTAVCRCEKSASLPWCDGTHRALERAARRRESDRKDAGGTLA